MKIRNLVLGAFSVISLSFGMVTASEALPITSSALTAPLIAEGQQVDLVGWRRRRVVIRHHHRRMVVRHHHSRRVIVYRHHRRRCALPFCL